MLDLADITSYEFMRPLVSGWLAKIESALTSKARKHWHEVSQECLMFYNKSAAAMWDPLYSKKFWRGVKAPRFRVTINKAFEFVAIFGPNLLWDIPKRTVTPKKLLELPEGILPPEQQQALMQLMVQETAGDKIICHLMDSWLNYTPREMPGNGLEGHNELAVLDCMLKGMGTLWPAPYSMPGSQKTLTGCFRKSPDDLIIDPDFKTMEQAKWIALRHIEPHWEVERRFKLPPNSLKNRATLESSWHYGEVAGRENEGQLSGERKAGKTNDLVVWYEIWSKLGTGARMTGMPDSIKGQLEEVVGDYAYLAICPDCPYPLNCPADKIRLGATSDEVRRCFEWPVPLWTDDRWPVEILRFYEDPESPYGVAPLAPALGELKAINAIVSWLVNRTWQTSRQMWAVLGQYHDEMKKYLEEGDDLCVLPIPAGADKDIRQIIQLIECNEVNKDAWNVLELLSNVFDKRTGLTEFGAYGVNQDGTQNRTAEETMAKQRAFGVRPEYMQKKVVAWQSRVASVEAILAWLFVKADDVQPLIGQAGAMLWQRYIENADYEQVMRQMRYEVSAASVRRPNRDRDISNLNEMAGRWLPEASKRAELTGDWEPINGLTKKFGELHDMDVELFLFPAQDPNDPQVAMQQQMQQAELQKTQAEAQKLQSEAQANPAAMKMQEMQLEQQNEQQRLAMDSQAKQQEMQLDLQKTQAEIALEIKKLEMELELKRQELAMKAQEHQMDMQFKAQEGQVDLAVKREQGAQQIAQGRQQMQMQKEQHQQQLKQGAESTKSKVEATKQTTQAKVSAMKATAAAKPKKVA